MVDTIAIDIPIQDLLPDLILKPVGPDQITIEIGTVMKGDPGPQGIPGVPGIPGPVVTFVWVQNNALMVWTIPHNLGRFPSVTVVDSTLSTVAPDITYIDNNTVRVSHSGAISGKAFLN